MMGAYAWFMLIFFCVRHVLLYLAVPCVYLGTDG